MHNIHWINPSPISFLTSLLIIKEITAPRGLLKNLYGMHPQICRRGGWLFVCHNLAGGWLENFRTLDGCQTLHLLVLVKTTLGSYLVGGYLLDSTHLSQIIRLDLFLKIREINPNKKSFSSVVENLLNKTSMNVNDLKREYSAGFN